MTEPEHLDRALQRFARSTSPLIVCDYDGVLAPIVDQPDQAFANRLSIATLVALADLPDTGVAVVSGRSVGALEALCPFPATIHLVGSHGSEYRDGPVLELDLAQIALMAQITDHLAGLAVDDGGFVVEAKPFSVAFHYRMAEPANAERAVTAIEQGPATWPDVTAKTGKKVIELVVVRADKGTAVNQLRHRLASGPVLFVGDDVTDEDAFRVLVDGDIGIKVGHGDTLAQHRVDNPAAVADLLTTLLEFRRPT